MKGTRPKIIIGSLIGALAIDAVFAACARGSLDGAADAADDAAPGGPKGNPSCTCGAAPAGPRGPEGAQGLPGSQGREGPQGAQGPQGAAGAFAGQIAQKGGNNGTVSCGTFCAGAQWGPTGTCVGAKLVSGVGVGTYIDCQTVPGLNNSLDCWCSQF